MMPPLSEEISTRSQTQLRLAKTQGNTLFRKSTLDIILTVSNFATTYQLAVISISSVGEFTVKTQGPGLMNKDQESEMR